MEDSPNSSGSSPPEEPASRNLSGDQNFTEVQYNAELLNIELDDRRQVLDLRSKWSECVRGWVEVSVLFGMMITIMLGFGIISYKDYPTFPGIVIVQILVQIIGLSLVIVKSLYPPKAEKK